MRDSPPHPSLLLCTASGLLGTSSRSPSPCPELETEAQREKGLIQVQSVASDAVGMSGLCPRLGSRTVFSDKPGCSHGEFSVWGMVSLGWGRGGRHIPAGGWVITGVFRVDFVRQSKALASPTAAELFSMWVPFPWFGQNPF